jgi:hypothetical protein
MPTGGTDGENVPKRCVTCEHVPFTVYTFSGGVIMRVRLGCLCSSMILYSDSKQSAAIPLVSCPSDLIPVLAIGTGPSRCRSAWQGVAGQGSKITEGV